MTGSSIEISTDRSRMDVTMIQEFLSQTYWAEGRSVLDVQTSIDNSSPFGLFVNGRQVAFARVLTDNVVFAYMMDIFVLPDCQRQGLGRRLVDYILAYEEFQNVRAWSLKTRDAHGFYRQFGFDTTADGERLMALVR